MQGYWISQHCRTHSNPLGGSTSVGSPPFWFVFMITFCGCPTVRSVAVGRAVLSVPTANGLQITVLFGRTTEVREAFYYD